ncbi:hypothetical protein B0T14DRAFT_123465 [Immersiella caudata]|uniref:Uncharacterized protein n=1 Tax=Immersiella caudata TaxID=314043 RepID=A0AA40C7F3_9PEZI|nr:hypothetical protein B0T14DRAFT_123465 [Immersiella caudata]
MPISLTVSSTLLFAYGSAFMSAVILTIFSLLNTHLMLVTRFRSRNWLRARQPSKRPCRPLSRRPDPGHRRDLVHSRSQAHKATLDTAALAVSNGESSRRVGNYRTPIGLVGDEFVMGDLLCLNVGHDHAGRADCRGRGAPG